MNTRSALITKSEKWFIIALVAVIFVIIFGISILLVHVGQQKEISTKQITPFIPITTDNNSEAINLITTKNLNWLIIGGGPFAAYNESNLEQDISIAMQAWGAKGKILFAGGPVSKSIRISNQALQGNPLLENLSIIFTPHLGRQSSYRSSTLPIAAAATKDFVHMALTQTLADNNINKAFFIYLVGFGKQANAAFDNTLSLWGDGAISALELAQFFDEIKTKRIVQIIATSCYSGGFAEIVFAKAQAKLNAPNTLRCGIFSTTADLPASGCHPDYNSDIEQNYNNYFWHALSSEDFNGAALPISLIDLDGDGKISTLEAHTRARLLASDIDIPTTTSERWLRAKANTKTTKTSTKVTLLEDDWLIHGLAHDTGLGDNETNVTNELAALEVKAKEMKAQLTKLKATKEQERLHLMGELLGRWPILDDPWHPMFFKILEHEGDNINDFLAQAKEFTALQNTEITIKQTKQDYFKLRRQIAPIARLARALKNRRLASQLKAAGGYNWDYYQSLLACERLRPEN
ncbi:MAG: hypothetical protein JW841_16400, partial [Deltaproteobacteria bacterium]|nr:hypothetical protein [Deltaproteobacteria bacterium]